MDILMMAAIVILILAAYFFCIKTVADHTKDNENISDNARTLIVLMVAFMPFVGFFIYFLIDRFELKVKF